jgi:hypothetical protein
MTEERRLRILQIAEELEAEGLKASNSAVYARALGHRGYVVAVMKERRSSQAGGVAEPEDEELPEPSAAELAEDLHALDQEYQGLHASLEQVWVLEKEGTVDLPTWKRGRWLEDQLTKNLQAQEQLRAALDTAQVKEAVLAAQAQHDAGLEEARQLAEHALHAVATMHDLFEDLAEVFGAQVDSFFKFRDLRGMQAFDVQSGRDYARRLFEAFFNGDPRSRDAFGLIMDTHLTVGMLRQALDNCVRLQPFSTTAIATYLRQQQSTEGHSNGNHS